MGPQHSLPDPRQRLMSMRAAQRAGQQEAAPVPFLNPDPIACLVGHSNEAPVIVDGQRMTALIDSGKDHGVQFKIQQFLYVPM